MDIAMSDLVLLINMYNFKSLVKLTALIFHPYQSPFRVKKLLHFFVTSQADESNGSAFFIRASEL